MFVEHFISFFYVNNLFFLIGWLNSLIMTKIMIMVLPLYVAEIIYVTILGFMYLFLLSFKNN